MARRFDGTGDHIEVGNLDMPRAGSWHCWFKPAFAQGDGESHVLFYSSSDANNSFSITKGADNTLSAGWLAASTPYRASAAAGTYTLSTDAWNSIAVTWNDQTASLLLFLNGSQIASASLDGLPVSTTGWATYLGNSGSAASDGCEGDLADVGLWDVPLVTATIEDLADFKAASWHDDNLIHYWKLIGDLQDSIGTNHGNDGTPATTTIVLHAPILFPGYSADMSTWLLEQLSKLVFGITGFTPSATLYIALLRSQPSPTDGAADLDEPSGAGYERISAVAADWNVAANSQITNNNALESTEATGPWGDLTHLAIVDSSSGTGNVYLYVPFAAAMAISSGERVSIGGDALVINWTAGSGISHYLASSLLNHVFGKATYTPGTISIALTDVSLSATNTGVGLGEPASGYGRLSTTSSDWAYSNGTVSTVNQMEMSEATGDWVDTFTHVALVSSNTTNEGQLLLWLETNSKTFVNRDVPLFRAGDLSYGIA